MINMRPQSLIKFLGGAWQLAGLRAPLVLARYARLVYFNRTSQRRPILRAAMGASGASVSAVQPGGDIVIPVYNNFDDTRALLDALKRDGPATGKLILVHDCSTDERVAPLLTAFCNGAPNAVLINNDRNRGFVQTCNRGIAASDRDVVILNTDIILPPGAVGRIFQCLLSSADIASVTPFSNNAYGVGVPRLVYINARPFGASTQDIDLCFQKLAPVAPIELPSGIGFCMGMSRKIIAELGAFDEKFGLGYGEETDFCQRAKAHGYKNMLVSNAYVYHSGGSSFGGTWQDKSRKATLEILSHYPKYVGAVGQHLRSGPTRSIGFAAMTLLAEHMTGNPLVISDDLAPASQRNDDQGPAPQLIIRETSNACHGFLRAMGEHYEFNFKDRTCLEQSLALRPRRAN